MFADTIKHYFIPHHTNGHRAKLLHDTSIIVLTFIFILYQIIVLSMPSAGVRILGYASNISIDEVVSLTNQKRVEKGVGVLATNPLLNEAAKRKGEDMLEKDYWAHVSPDGIQPWKFFNDQGYIYRYAGENLARDFSNAGAAVDAWIASPSHRENLLNEKYNEIGIAVVEGDLNGVDTTIIVQLFGTLQSGVATPVIEAVSDSLDNEIVTSDVVESVEGKNTSGSQYLLSQGPITEVGAVVAATSVSISPFGLRRTFALWFIGLLLVVLVADGFAASIRKTPRQVGRSFAHIAFLGMIFSIVLLAHAGNIL